MHWYSKDARDAGASDIHVKTEGKYIGVIADVDWMQSPYASFEELFQRIVPIGVARPNGFRSEIILMAVSDGVLVAGDGPAFACKLSAGDVPETLMGMAALAKRGLIWRFEEGL